MKKKAGIFFGAIMCVGTLIFGLTACKPEPPFVDESVYEINEKADFLAIANRLGDSYTKTEYLLKTDLDFTDTEWTPIGKSMGEAFTSTLDGKGHTIKIRMTEEEILPLTREDERAENGSRGLFGYMKDATVKNLTVAADFTFNVNETVSRVGAIAGFAAGDTTLHNVTVTGALTANLVGNYSYRDNADGSTIKMINNDVTLFMGGAVGYLIGDMDLKNVKADEMRLTAMKSEEEDAWWQENDLQHTFIYRDGAFGGIMGYVRPVDTSAQSARSAAQDLSASGSITVYAERANVGGLFGSMEKTDLVRGKADVTQEVYTRFRMNAGGAFGYAGNSVLSAVAAYADESGKPVNLNYYLLGDANTSRNAGGLAGYIDGGKLEHGIADVTLKAVGSMQFAGGIVGIAKDTTLDDLAASGAVFRSANGNTLDFWTHDDGFGGIVGRLHGGTVLKNADAAVDTFQGVVGAVLPSVSVETGAEENKGKDNVVTNVTAEIEAATVTYVKYMAAARKKLPNSEDIPENGIGTAVGAAELPADQEEAAEVRAESLKKWQTRRNEIKERYFH